MGFTAAARGLIGPLRTAMDGHHSLGLVVAHYSFTPWAHLCPS